MTTRTAQRKLRAADWTCGYKGLYWQDPVSRLYYAPVRAWVILQRRER